MSSNATHIFQGAGDRHLHCHLHNLHAHHELIYIYMWVYIYSRNRFHTRLVHRGSEIELWAKLKYHFWIPLSWRQTVQKHLHLRLRPQSITPKFPSSSLPWNFFGDYICWGIRCKPATFHTITAGGAGSTVSELAGVISCSGCTCINPEENIECNENSEEWAKCWMHEWVSEWVNEYW